MPTETRRRKPFIWPTWITGLLAGTAKCRYAAWYRAHFLFTKLPEDNEFDSDAYNRQHAAMVTARATELQRAGYSVGVEEANSFTLNGRTATLTGKPDIVAANGYEAIIVDEKGGKVKEEHPWQVKIYMWAMPIVEGALRDLHLSGELDYKNPSVGRIPVTLDDADVARITSTVRMVGADDVPAAAPSAAECRYCNIAACEFRHKSANPRAATVDTF